jgi:molybdate transport repressor ModE-like protein
MDAHLDLHTVRIVRAIAETGTISGAARALGYSQPAVSQHLQRAEARLGTPLVTRAARGVRLTEAGSVLARHALAITSALDAASGELADLSGLRTGSVRIAAFPTASSTIVPRLLGVMAETHPGIRLSYVEAEPPEALDLMREGSVDLAITFSYPGDPVDPRVVTPEGFAQRVLFTEDVLVVAPTRIDFRDRGLANVADLREEQWIGGCPRCRGHLLASCEAAGFIPSIAVETDNASAVLNLVASGIGVALLPRLALASSLVPEGVALLPQASGDERVIHETHLPGAERVPAIRATLDALATIDGSAWGLRAA